MSITFRRVALAVAAALTLTLVGFIPTAAQADGATGVGYSKKGLWTGSFKVHGKQVYCGDPSKAYPSKGGGYSALKTSEKWTNYQGKSIAGRDVKRAAYILGKYGVTKNKTQAAAVDMATWSLLGKGDYEWGDKKLADHVNRTGNGKKITALAKKYRDESTGYAGDYKVAVKAVPGAVGESTKVTVTVKSAAGKPMRGLTVAANISNDSTGAKTTKTNTSGTATLTLPVTKAGKSTADVKVTTPATKVRYFTPENKSAQRVMVSGYTDAVTRTVAMKSAPKITTEASAPTHKVSDAVYDTVTVTGLDTPTDQTGTARLYGPFSSTSAIRCTGTPAGTVTYKVTGDGTLRTPTIKVGAPGIYTWVASLPGDANNAAVSHACGVPAETFTVTRATPKISTNTSDTLVHLGTSLHDKVTISGLVAATDQTGTATLYGPFANGQKRVCTSATDVKTVTYKVTGNGTYNTPKVTVSRPGIYTWVAALPGDTAHNPARERCGIAAETSKVYRDSDTSFTIATGFGDDVIEEDENTTAGEGSSDNGTAPAPQSGEQRTGAPAARTAANSKATTSKASAPANRISIPAIKVSAAMDSVGVSDNKMKIPGNVKKVGWYSKSARPFDVLGNMIVAGHVSDRKDHPGALYKATKVKKGHEVRVTVSGKTYKYKVTSVKTYPRSKKLPGSVFDQKTNHRLVIVSCANKVKSGTGFHYKDNVVITAARV